MNADPVDAIMHVMKQAFDPAYGEAWTRRQVADSLLLPNTHYLLAGLDPHNPLTNTTETAGFALSRQAADEEELLLIAVRPDCRGNGVAKRLMNQLVQDAKQRGSARLFLEMRAGNPAEHLYTAFGFEQIGMRPGYYRGAKHGPLDAVTFGKSL